MSMLKVTQVRSQIGAKPKTRGTLRALGDSNVLPDRPEIRGMLHRVPHLVKVEPAEAGARRTEGPTSPEEEVSP
jgi:large subunit ribosomal protein L30